MSAHGPRCEHPGPDEPDGRAAQPIAAVSASERSVRARPEGTARRAAWLGALRTRAVLHDPRYAQSGGRADRPRPLGASVAAGRASVAPGSKCRRWTRATFALDSAPTVYETAARPVHRAEQRIAGHAAGTAPRARARAAALELPFVVARIRRVATKIAIQLGRYGFLRSCSQAGAEGCPLSRQAASDTLGAIATVSSRSRTPSRRQAYRNGSSAKLEVAQPSVAKTVPLAGIYRCLRGAHCSMSC
jgi:hypothetical protein